MFLKDQNKSVKTAADPMGAAMYSYIKTGELKSEGSSISEGIGQGRITGISMVPLLMTPTKFPMMKLCPSCSTFLRKKVFV